MDTTTTYTTIGTSKSLPPGSYTIEASVDLGNRDGSFSTTSGTNDYGFCRLALGSTGAQVGPGEPYNVSAPGYSSEAVVIATLTIANTDSVSLGCESLDSSSSAAYDTTVLATRVGTLH